MTTPQTKQTEKAAAILVAAAGDATSINDLDAYPNRWDGYDLDIETGSLRISFEYGQLEVFTFDRRDAVTTKASFGAEVPAKAVAAYVKEILGMVTTKAYEIFETSSARLELRQEDETGAGRAVLRVEIFFHEKFGGPAVAEVNWAGIGSVRPAVARQYAVMIARAAEIAEQLNAGDLAMPAEQLILSTEHAGAGWPAWHELQVQP